MALSKPLVLGILESVQKLMALGFKHSNINTSLYIFRCNAITIFILIYVDDIIITGLSNSVINFVIQSLSHEFVIKDLGKLSYFLGIELLPHNTSLFLTQHRYIQNLLKHTKMADAKPISSPMLSSSQLSLLAGVEFSNPTLYCNTVGALHSCLSQGLMCYLQSTKYAKSCIVPLIFIGV